MNGIDMSKVMEDKTSSGGSDSSDDGYRFYGESGRRIQENKHKNVSDMDDDEFLEKSREDFEEWIEKSGDDQVKMMTRSGEIVKTSSRTCGEGEYLFCHDGQGFIRVWKGFEEMSSDDFVFNYPDLSIAFDPEKGMGRPKVVTSIQEFDLAVVFQIFDMYRSQYQKQQQGSESPDQKSMDDLSEEEKKIVEEEMPSKEKFKSMSKEEKMKVQERIDKRLQEHNS